ncbi:MAG: phosphate ABC transporter substrate-binding protein [Chrysiogenetes bacterium]|nr:phosphate ABC transporter substrate-binding protein [Chrysiogenetes bacterium]
MALSHRAPVRASVCLLLAIGSIFIWSPPARAQTRHITWTGCGISRKAFMGEIAAAYEKETGIKIVLSGGGATKGIRDVAAGEADLGGSCRQHLLGKGGAPIPEETEAQLIQVGWDALVAVTHPDNPVSSIEIDQLRKVFAGEITNWKDLGGPDQPITLMVREGKESGVGHMFRLLVLRDPGFEFAAAGAQVFASTGPIEKAVAATPWSLAIDGVSSARKTKLKLLSIHGTLPTKANVATGRYPLFRPLYIAVGSNPDPEVRKVVDFILSPKGQAIISKAGTVTLAEGANLAPLWKKIEVRLTAR